jgi:hypothetical protein
VERKDSPKPDDLLGQDAKIRLVASHTHYLIVKIAARI